MFACERLGIEGWTVEVAGHAWRDLKKTFNVEGYWKAHNGYPSVTLTAEVLHGLALGRPPGWRKLADKAVQWLWAQQQEAGCWHRAEKIHSSEDTTVLVLDAIDLVEGRIPVTFSLAKEVIPLEQKPHWDGTRLLMAKKEIARIDGRAKNLRMILDVFEEENWPSKIDDPLPPDATGQKRRDAINGLNDKQDEINFYADGSGEGICWKRPV